MPHLSSLKADTHAPDDFTSQPEINHQDRHPKVAICLCTYRRQPLLNDLLAYLRRIPVMPPNTEIIIADNECSAETARIVEQYFPQAYYLQVPRRGLSEARNATVEQALFIGAEILVFIDDDDMPHWDWLTVLLRAQEKSGAPIIFGATLEKDRPEPHVVRATCNALVMAWAVHELERPWFDPALNFIGGEDAIFFERIETICGPGTKAADSIVFKNRQPDRHYTLGQLREAFQIGYRHIYVARLYGRFKRRTPAGWCLKESRRLLLALVTSPLCLVSARSRTKFIRYLGGTAGAFYAAMGGKSEPYRNPKC